MGIEGRIRVEKGAVVGSPRKNIGKFGVYILVSGELVRLGGLVGKGEDRQIVGLFGGFLHDYRSYFLFSSYKT